MSHVQCSRRSGRGRSVTQSGRRSFRGYLAVALLLLSSKGVAAFRAVPVAHWPSNGTQKTASITQRARGTSGLRCRGGRCVLKSSSSSTSGTESRGAGEDGRTSVGSDEENNWGMDDSIDVNAIRSRMMEKAGYAKRDDADAEEEWILVDKDGSNGVVEDPKDLFAGSLGSEALGSGSLEKADASKLVEELLQDEDIAQYFDEEFEKGASALRALAHELKTEEGTASYADTMAQELAEVFKAEEDRAAKEIEARQVPMQAKMDRATTELEAAMADASEARRAFEGDLFLQLSSFRTKGFLQQAAFVGAILVANQAVYQAILVADDRGGSPAFALGGLAASVGLVWFYGYRPFSL